MQQGAGPCNSTGSAAIRRTSMPGTSCAVNSSASIRCNPLPRRCQVMRRQRLRLRACPPARRARGPSRRGTACGGVGEGGVVGQDRLLLGARVRDGRRGASRGRIPAARHHARGSASSALPPWLPLACEAQAGRRTAHPPLPRLCRILNLTQAPAHDPQAAGHSPQPPPGPPCDGPAPPTRCR